MSVVPGVVLGLGAASALAAVHSLVAAMRYLGVRAARVRARPGERAPSKRPEVLLIVPCCGDEEGLLGRT